MIWAQQLLSINTSLHFFTFSNFKHSVTIPNLPVNMTNFEVHMENIKPQKSNFDSKYLIGSFSLRFITFFHKNSMHDKLKKSTVTAITSTPKPK